TTLVDYSKSIQLYERAIQLNFMQASHNLACMYWKGKGIQKNKEMAITLWKQSGCNKSLFSLAYAYLDNNDLINSFHYHMLAIRESNRTNKLNFQKCLCVSIPILEEP